MKRILCFKIETLLTAGRIRHCQPERGVHAVSPSIRRSLLSDRFVRMLKRPEGVPFTDAD
jgi:hypothetical protein